MASNSETHTLRDHDGFVEALYHLLWVKNINGEPCPDILVPDVIIYKYRIPAYWYFTGADGQLKRKNKASIVNKKIFAEFTKGVKSAHEVVAYHISENEGGGPGAPATTIQYFDTQMLHDFLFHKDKLNDGCLQKFIKPKGDHNSMIQAAWSPQICLLERRVNQQRLDATRVPLQHRCATYEGGEHLSKITPVRGTLLPDKIQQLCWGIVSHVRTTSHEHQHISRLLLNFKSDEQARAAPRRLSRLRPRAATRLSLRTRAAPHFRQPTRHRSTAALRTASGCSGAPRSASRSRTRPTARRRRRWSSAATARRRRAASPSACRCPCRHPSASRRSGPTAAPSARSRARRSTRTTSTSSRSRA